MVTSEERMKILKMIQEGTISAEQGMQLLESLQEPKKTPIQLFNLTLLPLVKYRVGSGCVLPIPIPVKYASMCVCRLM